MGNGVIVLLSGGMDSTTLFYKALHETNIVQALSFNYGQRHIKEVSYASNTAWRHDVPHEIIDITSIGKFLKGSALSDPDVEVPHGHYAEDNMRITVVPNRNMIMLSQAVGAAIGLGADSVWAAMHAGDHPVYPDCRPEFIEALNHAIGVATETSVNVYTPFINIDKTEIARIGQGLGVPWEKTWSCYEGNQLHCGKCGTCVERAEALYLAGVDDPTEYENPEYWKEVIGI